MQYRQLIALLMVFAYLILPLDSFAGHHSPVAPGLSSASSFDQLSSSSASDAGCPCSDRDGSADHRDGSCDGCSCCSCSSFLAPLPAAIAWSALRPARSYIVHDPIQRFPEVYLPIFVPPQNRG